MERIDKISGTFGKRQAEVKKAVPSAVIRRLPKYHRCLDELLKTGRLRISSAELSEIMDMTASQLRQDLNYFGGFGQQGYGYNIKFLYTKISELLGVKEGYNAVIIGAGKLGQALAATSMFEIYGVKKTAMFDVDARVIGSEVCGLPVYSIDELEKFCKSNSVQIAVLTVPSEATSKVAEAAVLAGVKGIWNFSGTELNLETLGVVVENIHLGDSLMTLCYEMKTTSEKGDKNG